MSWVYEMIESWCYRSNRSRSGGFKRKMEKSILFSDGTEKPPFWASVRVRMSQSESHGCTTYIFSGKKNSNGKIVLFIHGGGGMSRPTFLHYDFLCRLIKRTGVTVYMPFYPLAPDYNVRDALDVLDKIYSDLKDKYGNENIVFMGDSAGANLILSLADRAQERPESLVVISPAFGIENGEPRDIRLSYEEIDPILSVKMNDVICENWARNVPLNSRDISPEYVDYTKLPRMLFVYGTHELFYPLVERAMFKIKKDNARVLVFEKKACHDFALCSFLPEGREAQKRIFDFVEGASNENK